MKKYLLLLSLVIPCSNLYASFDEIESQEEIYSYELLFEKDPDKKNSGGTAHILIKTTKRLLNPNLILSALSPYCLKNGCILSYFGPFTQEGIFIYGFQVTGPHKNPFKKKDVITPSFPYSLNLTIPKKALRSIDGDLPNKDIKIQVSYTSQTWNVSFQ